MTFPFNYIPNNIENSVLLYIREEKEEEWNEEEKQKKRWRQEVEKQRNRWKVFREALLHLAIASLIAQDSRFQY